MSKVCRSESRAGSVIWLMRPTTTASRVRGVARCCARRADRAVGARQHGKAVVRIAHRPDGPVGTDFFAHAAAHTGLFDAGLLPDHGQGEMLGRGLGKGLARNRHAAVRNPGLNGIEGARRHAGAAHGAAFRVVFDGPEQIVDADVLGFY